MKKKTFAMNMISVMLIWFGAVLVAGCDPDPKPEIESKPAAPTGVSATAESESSIRVSLNVVEGVERYIVYRSGAANGVYANVSGDNGVAATPFTDTGLQHSTTYYYKVAAQNAAGISDQSPYASTMTNGPPPAPSGVALRIESESSIQVSWNAGAGASSYIVYRSNTADGEYVNVSGTNGTTSTSFTNIGLQASTIYYYKVAAQNGIGTSSQSSSASATTPTPKLPATPSGVTAIAHGTHSILVSWSVVIGATRYYVYRSTMSNGLYTEIGSKTDTSYIDDDLGRLSATDTRYYYKVAASNSVGTGQRSGYASASN